ncbi:chromate transporter [Brevibacillus fulvus]|uniref:Chromate transporter n=1 Tax=Brevibacillus fulvus TaxID=1125967 RepID=A0A938Y1L5_9BACL|nr:chromate transporter [Brevibacillus fulvus]MBM7590331.1 chromate transporter [Brevibacillus fulvus]
MIYLQLFWGFFIANILGYGGGPPSIPLVQNEVVNHYHWMTNQEFGEMLAVANALPSPIATKLAGYVGYEVAGVAGSIVALIATIAPTAIAMVLLLGFLNLFQKAPQVKAMTQSVRPIVAVMTGILAVEFFQGSIEEMGLIHTVVLAALAFFFLERKKIHPAIAIAGAMVYGIIFIK